MARILHGDTNFAAALTFGGVQNAMRSYVDQEMIRAQQMMQGVGQNMFQKAAIARDAFINSNAFRLAEAAIRQVQSLWGQNVIQPLPQLWQVQNAPLVMQPFMMAHVGLRTLYHQQRCDGYSETYVDMEPTAKGQNHLPWQMVMNGAYTGETDEYDGVFTTYSYEEDPSMKPLSFEEQLDIRNAWDVIDHAIADGKDPSSRWNDLLG